MKISQGIINIYNNINELDNLERITDRDEYYQSKVSERLDECSEIYLDNIDEVLGKLLDMDISMDNLSQISKLIKKLSKLITNSYKGFLDLYYLMEFYKSTEDQIYSKVKHLYQ